MLASKSKKDRRYAIAAEQQRHGNAQPSHDVAPSRFEKGLTSTQFLDRTQAPLVILLAVLRQILRAGRPVKKANAKPFFKPCDGLSDGRTSEGKPFGSPCEPASLDCLDEHLHTIKSITHLATGPRKGLTIVERWEPKTGRTVATANTQSTLRTNPRQRFWTVAVRRSPTALLRRQQRPGDGSLCGAARCPDRAPTSAA